MSISVASVMHRSGHMYSFWKGKLIAGPHYGVLTLTNLLIIVPSLLCVFYTSCSVVLSIFVAIPFIGSEFFLLKCALTDPGVFPRCALPPDVEQPEPSTMERVAYLVKLQKGTGYAERHVVLERRYCYTCNLLRPLRTHHCPFCGVCVEKLDHHCPWTGTCIGIRNHRYFFWFVWFTTLLAALSSITCIVGLTSRAKTRLEGQNLIENFLSGASETHYVELILLIYSIFIFLLVGGLAVYHSYLVAVNVTTNEEMRNTFHDGENPFDKGLVRNVFEELLQEVPISRLSGCDTHEDEHLALAGVRPDHLRSQDEELQAQELGLP